MAKIIAPNKSYTGISASVAFCNGEGKADNPHLIEWFRKNGYKVVEDTVELGSEVDEDNSQLKNMNEDELKLYAEEKGIDLGKATSKEGILTKIKEAEKKGAQ